MSDEIIRLNHPSTREQLSAAISAAQGRARAGLADPHDLATEAWSAWELVRAVGAFVGEPVLRTAYGTDGMSVDAQWWTQGVDNRNGSTGTVTIVELSNWGWRVRRGVLNGGHRRGHVQLGFYSEVTRV